MKADPDLGKLPAHDRVGQAGVEQAYDSYLRGIPGKQVIQVNAQGEVLNTDTSGRSRRRNGDNVVLSIDAKAQQLAEQSLALGIAVAHNTYDSESGKYLQATGGAAIVMDPHTGRILALASNPTFDPSIWVGGLSQKHYDQIKGTGSVRARCSTGRSRALYPPGSTFKPFVGAAALKQRSSTSTRRSTVPASTRSPATRRTRRSTTGTP